MSSTVVSLLHDIIISDFDVEVMLICNFLYFSNAPKKRSIMKPREKYYHPTINHNDWLHKYDEIIFFQLFRMKKTTFHSLMIIIVENDNARIITKKYRGGNYPVNPEKGLLITLWYLSKGDSLISIADRFGVVPSTIMQVVNAFLYVIVRLKNLYIVWPATEQDRLAIQNGFEGYPGVMGAIDGTHVNVKVPIRQHDSYIDRYHRTSINLTAVCTSNKIFTYIYAGFPGCAHDARVFSHSLLCKNIVRYGKENYFPNDDNHLIGDSAYPLRTWLMVPYKGQNLTRIQRNHNNRLSSARVCIENAFAFLKGRWSRLKFINTYTISKAVEIVTAACVLHNFCLLQSDEWEEEYQREIANNEEYEEEDRMARRLGEIKRDEIAQTLLER